MTIDAGEPSVSCRAREAGLPMVVVPPSTYGITKRPELRGKRYGPPLMEAALEDIRKAGFKHARLQVYANNWPAIGFYERLGFRRYIDIMKLDL